MSESKWYLYKEGANGPELIDTFETEKEAEAKADTYRNAMDGCIYEVTNTPIHTVRTHKHSKAS